MSQKRIQFPTTHKIPSRSRAFRRRRGLNWTILGLTYSCMYTGRYNLSLTNPILSMDYGWDKAEIGTIITPALLSYGICAFLNGLIADHLGGKKSFLIGALGAGCCNLLFGLGAYLGFLGRGYGLLGYFAGIWMLNSYFQSFGVVALIKINAAWFARAERGVFSAIFGSMIQIGRVFIFVIGPILVLRLSWQWLFFIPAILISAMAMLCFFGIADHPQDAGFREEHSETAGPTEPPVSLQVIFKKIFTNPVSFWITGAEFCTGFVRHGFEQWFPRYLVEVHHMGLSTGIFQKNTFLIVAASVCGFLTAGTLSDWVFQGRRPPVAFCAYALQGLALLLMISPLGPTALVLVFMLHAASISMAKAMLSGTAAADWGGRQAVATAAGLFDGMEYVGGSLAGVGMGWLLDSWGWNIWAPSMIGFSFIAGVCMLMCWRAEPTPELNHTATVKPGKTSYLK